MAESEHLPCDIAELRTLFLFESLTEEQLDFLCTRGHVERREPGVLFAEGDPAVWFYVLIEGEVSINRTVGEDDVEVTRTTQRGVYSGAWAAYLGDRVPQTYANTMRILAPSRFYVLGADDFGQFMRDEFPMAVHLLEGAFWGRTRTDSVIGQRERLLALGSLSAGLTHELNNPAAAAVRATVSLRERVAGMRSKLRTIAGGTWDREALESLIRLQEDAVEHISKAPELSPLEASDREDELTDWFEDHGIRAGWDMASTFVQAGLDVAWLDRVVETVDPSVVEGAVRWLNYTLETELLMNEVEDATTRISTLVGAAKQYSQLDRGPVQLVDVHELLDSTLVMLSKKIASGVSVVKDYDRSLPQLRVFASELNQVWTNLIDNALQAMGSPGTLTLRTSLVGENVLIEIGDTGPGIAPELVNRIFEPFFTTKPIGEGTGLGLDISWRIVVNKHHGDLSVQSEPGNTRFLVTLPVAGVDLSVVEEAEGRLDLSVVEEAEGRLHLSVVEEAEGRLETKSSKQQSEGD